MSTTREHAEALYRVVVPAGHIVVDQAVYVALWNYVWACDADAEGKATRREVQQARQKLAEAASCAS